LLQDRVGLGTNPGFKVLDVERMMEVFELLRCCRFSMKNFELWREVIVGDKRMHHFCPFGLHRVLFAELILGDIFIVEVTHSVHPINYYDGKSYFGGKPLINDGCMMPQLSEESWSPLLEL